MFQKQNLGRRWSGFPSGRWQHISELSSEHLGDGLLSSTSHTPHPRSRVLSTERQNPRRQWDAQARSTRRPRFSALASAVLRRSPTQSGHFPDGFLGWMLKSLSSLGDFNAPSLMGQDSNFWSGRTGRRFCRHGVDYVSVQVCISK